MRSNQTGNTPQPGSTADRNRAPKQTGSSPLSLFLKTNLSMPNSLPGVGFKHILELEAVRIEKEDGVVTEPVLRIFSWCIQNFRIHLRHLSIQCIHRLSGF